MYNKGNKKEIPMELNYPELVNKALLLQQNAVNLLFQENNGEIFIGDLLRCVFSMCFAPPTPKFLSNKDLQMIKNSSDKLTEIIENITSEKIHNDLKQNAIEDSAFAGKNKKTTIDQDYVNFIESDIQTQSFDKNSKEMIKNHVVVSENPEKKQEMVKSSETFKLPFSKIENKAPTKTSAESNKDQNMITLSNKSIKTNLSPEKNPITVMTKILSKTTVLDKIVLRDFSIYSSGNLNYNKEMLHVVTFSMPYYLQKRIKTYTSKSQKFKFKKVTRKEQKDEEKKDNQKKEMVYHSVDDIS